MHTTMDGMTQNNKPNKPKRNRDYKAEYQRRMAKAKAETGKGYNETRSRGSSKGTPTGDTYAAFQLAYDRLNRRLFKGELPHCMITLRTFGKARGYFSPHRFANLQTVATTHEIALDPRQFIERTPVEILSTLAHEMCHLWQQEFGSPSRNAYHNREWGEKMKSIGLHPSDTGQPGGKETGQKVSHYIIEGGPFETEATKLVESGKFQQVWIDVEGLLAANVKGPLAKLAPRKGPKGGGGSKSGKRIKYTCPECRASVWGKGGLVVACEGSTDEGHTLTGMEVND